MNAHKSSSWTRNWICEPSPINGITDEFRICAASLPNIPPEVVSINQPGPDHQRAICQRDFFNLQFRLSVKRTAAVERADAGNENDFRDFCRARGLQNFPRAFHVHRANFIPAHRLEIIGAMHQRAGIFKRRRRNFIAELKFHGARSGLWLARQFQNFPAARGKIIFDAAADVAAAAGDRADFFSLINSICRAALPSQLNSKFRGDAAASLYRIAAVSQPMRWALAMTEKVIVVAGMLGNTLASTAWTRDQPCGRPRQSLSNCSGFSRIGIEPPL